MASPTSFFTDNLGTKLLALLLALAVYAHVQTEKEQEARFRSTLVLRGLDPGLVLAAPPPGRVELSLRARGKQLLKLRVREPEVVVDLSGVRSGEVQRVLSAADVVLPLDAEAVVTAIHEPRVLSLIVDTLIARRVPVEIPLLGDLPAHLGWRGNARTDPPAVEVRGPSAVVNALASVSVKPINLAEVGGSLVRGEPVLVASGVTVEPDSVRVILPVIETELRTLGPLPIRVTGLRRGLVASIEPDSAAIVVSGSFRRLETLDTRSAALRVDLRDLEPGLHSVLLDVRLFVDSLEVRETVPARVRARVERRSPR